MEELSWDEKQKRELDWMNNLKAGDEVFTSRPFGGIPGIKKVSRITKTQIFVWINERYEQGFRKKDGREVGGNLYTSTYLIMPTKENRESTELRQLKVKAKEMVGKVVIPKTKDEVTALINAILPFIQTKDSTKMEKE